MLQYGFIKTAAGTPHIRLGDTAWNAQQINTLADRAHAQGVQILCCPELCITGATCGDLFYQQQLLQNAADALHTIAQHSMQHNVLLTAGLPIALDGLLFNCTAVIHSGKVLGVVPAAHITAAQSRWFAPGTAARSCVLPLNGETVPFSSDLLFDCGSLQIAIETGTEARTALAPGLQLALQGAALLLMPDAAPETVGSAQYRRDMLKMHSAAGVCACVYAGAGCGESTTDLVFAGHKLIAENGTLLAQAAPFAAQDDLLVSHIDAEKLLGERRRTAFGAACSALPAVRRIAFALGQSSGALVYPVDSMPFIPGQEQALFDRCEEIFAIQVAGLAHRLQHINAKHAVVNISGGLDSTLALLVTARAFDTLGLPRSGITTLTLPGFGTTDRTYHNAMALMRLLGCTVREISIVPAVTQHFADIGHDIATHDITYENSQARERTQIAMDVANQLNCPVIGTGDLSELALGWATYNGDHMSMYGVNAGIPKTLMRHMVRHIANLMEGEVRTVLLDIVDTPVSPELLPHKDGEIQQKTEDIVGPYELHDFYLYHMLRYGFGPAKIYCLAQAAFAGRYSSETILKWLKVFLRRFFTQQYKRSCLPDGPKVGSVGLSPRGDWQMPSDAVFRQWLEAAEKLV